MRRDSKRAKRLAEATGATDSRLEAWSHTDKDGIAFLSPEGSPQDEALVTALLTVGTEGRDRASTTLIVASRFGLACHGFKTALRQRLQLDDPEVAELTAPLDTDETGELTDESFVEAERRAAVVAATSKVDAVSEAMHRKVTESAPTYGETPETLWHSWTTLLVTVMSGGNPYYTPAAAAILGVDAGEVGAHVRDDGAIVLDPGGGFGAPTSVPGIIAESFAKLGTFNMMHLRHVIDEVAASDLARLAPQLQPVVRGLAAVAGVAYDADRDEAAACLVPLLLAIGPEAVTTFTAMGTIFGAMLRPQPDQAQGIA
jgi:hypothetical protein